MRSVPVGNEHCAGWVGHFVPLPYPADFACIGFFRAFPWQNTLFFNDPPFISGLDSI
jgi:hypothetical protein